MKKNRGNRLVIRLTAEEHLQLKQFATDMRLTTAQYVRDSAFFWLILSRGDDSSQVLLDHLDELFGAAYDALAKDFAEEIPEIIDMMHDAIRFINKRAQDAPPIFEREQLLIEDTLEKEVSPGQDTCDE